ncbi:MAG: hypothetical protein HOP08_07215 [Cyclobacteriaceae bacterium]|nr:hypothetical protein [Cyclobacteriaceae bacterium]
MKIKRLLSLTLILLTLLCSSRSFSQVEKAVKVPQEKAQFVEFSQANAHEFRESVKITFQEESRSNTTLFCQQTPHYYFHQLSLREHEAYLKADQLNLPSKKLFIDFGAIII